MKTFASVLLLSANSFAGGLPVYDTVRHAYDTVSNTLQFAQDIENLYTNIENRDLSGLMYDTETALLKTQNIMKEWTGYTGDFGIDTTEVGYGDMEGIFQKAMNEAKEISGIINQNDDVYGTIDRTLYKVESSPVAQGIYKEHDKKREMKNEYTIIQTEIQKKRARINIELRSLAIDIDKSNKIEQREKLSNAVSLLQAQLIVLQQEEDEAYKKYQMEVKMMDVAVEERQSVIQEQLRLEKIREHEANEKRRDTYSPDDDI